MSNWPPKSLGITAKNSFECLLIFYGWVDFYLLGKRRCMFKILKGVLMGRWGVGGEGKLGGADFKIKMWELTIEIKWQKRWY